METASSNVGKLLDSAKQFARRLITIGENRLELLMIEMREEREHLLHILMLALAVLLFGCLALLALNVTIVVLLWDISPLGVLAALTAFYATGAVILYLKLSKTLRDWKLFQATLDQIRKDTACLTKSLG